MHYIISVFDMQESILPTDCRGCGRNRLPLSLTQMITIDLASTGSPSTSMNTIQEHISIAIACTQDSYDFAKTLPRIAGIRRRCKEYFLKLASNTVVYFYILYNGYNLSQFLSLFIFVNAMTDRSYRYFINFFYKKINCHAICSIVYSFKK